MIGANVVANATIAGRAVTVNTMPSPINASFQSSCCMTISKICLVNDCIGWTIPSMANAKLRRFGSISVIFSLSRSPVSTNFANHSPVTVKLSAIDLNISMTCGPCVLTSPVNISTSDRSIGKNASPIPIISPSSTPCSTSIAPLNVFMRVDADSPASTWAMLPASSVNAAEPTRDRAVAARIASEENIVVSVADCCSADNPEIAFCKMPAISAMLFIEPSALKNAF